jgi:hypothetical protein
MPPAHTELLQLQAWGGVGATVLAQLLHPMPAKPPGCAAGKGTHVHLWDAGQVAVKGGM